MPSLTRFELGATDTADIESRVTFETDQATFESWVARVKDYILDGDVMQVVISQRMTLPFQAEPLNLYRALRHLNPSPYLFFSILMIFMSLGVHPVWSAQNAVKSVRPIAGTIRRGATEVDSRTNFMTKKSVLSI